MTITHAQQLALDTIRIDIAAERKKSNLMSWPIPIMIRKKLLALVEEGLPLLLVARETGVSRQILSRWRDNQNRKTKISAAPTPPPRIFVVEPDKADTPSSDSHSPGTLRLTVGELVITIATARNA